MSIAAHDELRSAFNIQLPRSSYIVVQLVFFGATSFGLYSLPINNRSSSLLVCTHTR